MKLNNIPKYRVVYSKDLDAYAVLNNTSLKIVSEYTDKWGAEKTCKALNIRLNFLKESYVRIVLNKSIKGA